MHEHGISHKSLRSLRGLKKIASGDPEVKLDERSDIELISKLKHFVNITAQEIGGIVDQSHEFAIVLAELFDVLHKVSGGIFSPE